MKAVIFILVFALMFFHPRHASALETKQCSVSYSFYQNIQNENSSVTDRSQGQNSYFDDDLSDKDDDDINHTARKKFSFGSAVFNVTELFSSTHILYNVNSAEFCSMSSFQFPLSRFISLQVFRW